MKLKMNYYLTKQELETLLIDAGFNKVDYIIPLYDSTFHFVYKARVNGKTVILKIQKDNCISLSFEKDKLLNEYNASLFLDKETEISHAEILYTNSNYIEKKLERPKYIYSIYKYQVSSQLSAIKPSKEEKQNLEFSIGELIGNLTTFKKQKYGYPSLGFETSYSVALEKMVDSILEDERKILSKNTKNSLLLKEVVTKVKPHLLLVPSSFVLPNLDWSNIYYLNKNEPLTILNLGDYFFGDFLGNLTSINPMDKLETKTYLIQGFNSTSRIPLDVDDEEIKIRYYILLLYKGIVTNLKAHLCYKPLSISQLKEKTLAKAICLLATIQLKQLLDLDKESNTNDKKEEQDLLDEFNELIDVENRKEK